ncbi:MAG: hypothetical protein ABH878_00465 [bacterium]
MKISPVVRQNINSNNHTQAGGYWHCGVVVNHRTNRKEAPFKGASNTVSPAIYGGAGVG